MRSASAFVLVLAACTSAEPRAQPAGDRPAALAITPAPAPVADAAHWYWDERANVDPMRHVSGWRVVGEGPLELQLVRDDVAVIEVAVPGSAGHDSAAIAVHEGAVYVAHYHMIASGARLARFAADGAVEWDVPLQGLGPIDHSKYWNRVQLAIDNGNPIVFGLESSGRYTELVDATSGQTIAHGRPSPMLADAAWSFARASGANDTVAIAWADVPEGGEVVLEGTHGRVRFRENLYADEDARLELVRGDRRVWSRSLIGEGSCGRAAMLELGDRVWVLRWCAIATGAELLAFDGASGRTLVSRRLRALPDVGHSEYIAAHQLRAVDGHPVVFGFEAAGRWLEAIDPDTGATLVSRTWR